MSVNNDNFLIETSDIELAQHSVNGITDDNIRNRAMANVLAAKLALKYFTDADIDVGSGIHNVADVLKDIDVSDIYIQGNYIDVRIFFDENEIYVPKSHFDSDMLPLAYMFIKTDGDLSDGFVTGFAFPEDIDTTTDINGYYQVKTDELKSFYDVEARITTVTEDDIDARFKKDVYDFLDGKISGRKLYKTLVSSFVAREFLAECAGANTVLSLLNLDKLTGVTESAPDELLRDAGSVETPMLLESDFGENIELVPSDNFEFIEPDEHELQELDETEIEELNTDSDELSIELSDNNFSDNSENSIGENLYDETYIEPESLSEESEKDTAADNVEELELVEDEESEEDDPYIPNENFASRAETSGMLEKSAPPPLAIRPRFVIMDDEIPQNPISTIEEEPDEFNELSKFDYSTEIMPSISSIESDSQAQDSLTEEMLANSVNKTDDKFVEEKDDTSTSGEQIENLFGQNPHKTVNTSRKKGSPLPFFGFIVILGALGYYGYTKFYSPVPDVINNNTSSVDYKNESVDIEKPKPKEVAMPVETVENIPETKTKDEAVSVSIPAIEQNLNASVDVSNLSINWEVPLSYANNTTAKRYFVKIGKILQLNLKTELLFLSSSPITNKISVELEFNKGSNKFVISKFIESSGRTNIDDVIKSTIEKTLNMNSNTNMAVFKNLQGNPVLVIKL